MNLEIWAINHKIPEVSGVFGGISRQFISGTNDTGMHVLEPRYADMRCPYHLWKTGRVAPYIGFHGYRKFINFRDPVATTKCNLAPGWEEVPHAAFLAYQYWLATRPAATILQLLEGYDLLTVEPFDCGYNGTISDDYIKSRSRDDWWAFEDAMIRHGFHPKDFLTHHIRPMHFVTTDRIFCKFMQRWADVMFECEPKVKSEDAKTDDYPPRSLAYLSERFWSLWVERQVREGLLRIKTLPLMICWSAY